MKVPNAVHEANMGGLALIAAKIARKNQICKAVVDNCPTPELVATICRAAQSPSEVDMAFEIYEAAERGWTNGERAAFNALMR